MAACLLGLVCGWGLSLETSQADSPAPSESQPAQEIPEPEEEPALDFVRDVADEFGMEREIVRLVHRYSKRYVDESKPEWRLLRTPESMTYLMISLIAAESRGKPNAVGDDGRARGLTQIWVSTANQYGTATAERLLDPEVNIAFSYKHFHYLLKRYEGNFALAVCAWNRGAAGVDRLIRYGKTPARNYSRKVYAAAMRHRQEGGAVGR